MNGRGSPKSDKIAGVRVRLRAAVRNVDIHLGKKVVFLLLARREEELFSNRDVVCVSFTPDSAIWLANQSELFQLRRRRLIDDRADRCLIFRIENDALIALTELIQQHGFADPAAAICQVQLNVIVPDHFHFLCERGSRFGCRSSGGNGRCERGRCRAGANRRRRSWRGDRSRPRWGIFDSPPLPPYQSNDAKCNGNPRGSIHKIPGDFESRATPGSSSQNASPARIWICGTAGKIDMSRNRIFTGAAPGMTSGDSFQSQKKSAHGPVQFDGLQKVFRTSRLKSASRAGPADRDQ